MEEHRGVTLQSLMSMYYRYNKSKKNISLLKAYKVSAETIKDDNTSDFYLLNIDLENRMLNIEKYHIDDYEEAILRYFILEDFTDPQTNSVVLVNVDNYRELKEAYPSYFSDISEFIQALDKVEENCIRLNLI